MSEKPYAVIGAGGNARVVVDLLLAAGRPVAAVVAAERVAEGALLEGVPVIGGDDAFAKRYRPGDVVLVNGLGGVGENLPRRRLYERYATAGYAFAPLVHPAATVSEGARLSAGCVVMAGAVVQTGAYLAENVLVNSGAVVEHGCRVGAHAHVATGAILCGDVLVGEGAHVGAGATVAQGRTVGAGAIVGAGAVVIADLSDNVTAVGVPAVARKTKR